MLPCIYVIYCITFLIDMGGMITMPYIYMTHFGNILPCLMKFQFVNNPISYVYGSLRCFGFWCLQFIVFDIVIRVIVGSGDLNGMSFKYIMKAS